MKESFFIMVIMIIHSSFIHDDELKEKWIECFLGQWKCGEDMGKTFCWFCSEFLSCASRNGLFGWRGGEVTEEKYFTLKLSSFVLLSKLDSVISSNV